MLCSRAYCFVLCMFLTHHHADGGGADCGGGQHSDISDASCIAQNLCAIHTYRDTFLVACLSTTPIAVLTTIALVITVVLFSRRVRQGRLRGKPRETVILAVAVAAFFLQGFWLVTTLSLGVYQQRPDLVKKIHIETLVSPILSILWLVPNAETILWHDATIAAAGDNDNNSSNSKQFRAGIRALLYVIGLTALIGTLVPSLMFAESDVDNVYSTDTKAANVWAIQSCVLAGYAACLSIVWAGMSLHAFWHLRRQQQDLVLDEEKKQEGVSARRRSLLRLVGRTSSAAAICVFLAGCSALTSGLLSIDKFERGFQPTIGLLEPLMDGFLSLGLVATMGSIVFFILASTAETGMAAREGSMYDLFSSRTGQRASPRMHRGGSSAPASVAMSNLVPEEKQVGETY